VRVSDPREDRFPLRSLLLVFFGCALLGVLGAQHGFASRRLEPTPTLDVTAAPESHDAGIEPAAPTPPQPIAPELIAPVPAAPEPIAPAPAVPDSVVPVAAPTPAPQPRPVLVLEPGQVAYLRCDGVEQADARFPCPRDRALEEATWALLRTLPQCTVARLTPGRGEVRLNWHQGTPPEVLVKIDSGDRIAAAAVSKCAGDRLTTLQSSLRASRAVVAFRFELR
jgi:hypothetical protein